MNTPTGATRSGRGATKLWIAAALIVLSALVGWVFVQHRGAAGLVERADCALPDDRNARHPGMVWIPDGRFLIGGRVYKEEGPQADRSVQGFWMDRTEVTNAQFAEFVKATGYITRAEKAVDPRLYPSLPPDMQQAGAVVFTMPTDVSRGGDITQWWKYRPGANWKSPDGPGSSIANRPAHPAVALTFEDALAYAQWKGRDLPTEAEWEWAARAGQAEPDTASLAAPASANTWQGLFPMVNLREDGFAVLAPVGCFSPNAYGLFDMIGNVWELTRDVYLPFHANDALPQAQPLGRAPFIARAPTHRVIKGGSYLCAQNYCMRYRAAARQGQEEDLATGHIGFRTVLRSKAADR